MPVAPQPSHGYFYPRSPCGERLTILLITVTTLLFLSTLSLRRATTSGATYLIFLAFLSTLSLRRATEQQLWQNINTYISIHALLAESDGTGFFVLDERHDISIHALLAESDTPTLESLTPTQTFLSTLSLRRATRPVSALYSVNRYFYPRSPCGERRHFSSKQRTLPKFLSTLSLRRATVSQHSPSTVHTKFLSTLSLRRATIFFCSLLLLFDISIHALLAESDNREKRKCPEQ